MADFAFEAAARWARFAPRARQCYADLPFLGEAQAAGPALLLDTCVYIDRMQGLAPTDVVRAVGMRPVNHSTVAVQELMHPVGVLDPDDGRRLGDRATDRCDAPAPRLPPRDVLGRAALLSGLLSRLQGYATDGRLRALQDCVLFLQAQKLGLTMLTRNIADFDILLQFVPSGRALLYRTV